MIVVVPVSATPQPVTIRGTIHELNESDQTMGFRGDYLDAYEKINVNEIYFYGGVPNPDVFGSLKKGDLIEATFMGWPWTWSRFDPSTGRSIRTIESPFLVRWCAIQKLAERNNSSDLIGTDVFGDPDFLAAPLAGEYVIEYEIRGPQSEPFDTSTTPPGTMANITLKRGIDVIGNYSLRPGESFGYQNPSEKSFISVAFIGGHATDERCGSRCRTCADFTVRIQSDDITGQDVIPSNASFSLTQKASPHSLTGLVALGCIVIWKLRGNRRRE